MISVFVMFCMELMELEEDEDMDDEKFVLVLDFIFLWNLVFFNMLFGRYSYGIVVIGNQFFIVYNFC